MVRAEEAPGEAPEGQAGQAREDQAEQGSIKAEHIFLQSGAAVPAEQGPEGQEETQPGHEEDQRTQSPCLQ